MQMNNKVEKMSRAAEMEKDMLSKGSGYKMLDKYVEQKFTYVFKPISKKLQLPALPRSNTADCCRNVNTDRVEFRQNDITAWEQEKVEKRQYSGTSRPFSNFILATNN